MVPINNFMTRPYLITRDLCPENQECPIHFMHQMIIHTMYFYRRNHFQYPTLPQQSFFLPIIGEVKRPLVFSYPYLLSMPFKYVTAVLECSGNKRAHFEPKVYGEQWEDGAINQGVWKGVPLSALLPLTGVSKTAKEVVFEGYDHGNRKDLEGIFSFARSLPLEKAIDPDTLIAYEYNGRPIPYKHGYPLRLIVPGWYGMASVKWLKSITVIDHEFKGPFQAVDYVYYPYKDSDKGKRPVTNINVNSIIQRPLNHSVLDTGTHKIEGIAYTGVGAITKVEVSTDQGLTWDKAPISKCPGQPYSWAYWSYNWDVKDKGEYTIMVRAADSAGRMQPYEAEWNRKGYGYNKVTTIKVKVE